MISPFDVELKIWIIHFWINLELIQYFPLCCRWKAACCGNPRMQTIRT